MSRLRVRPLGGAMGCLVMIVVSVVASVLLTILLNIGPCNGRPPQPAINGAIARAIRLGRPVRRSSQSARLIARSPALMPSQRSGSGSQRARAVADPGQPGQLGVVAEHEVGERAAGEVGGADAVADVAAGPAQAGGRGRARPTRVQSRAMPERAAPRVGDRGVAQHAGTGRRSVACSAANTRRSRS